MLRYPGYQVSSRIEEKDGILWYRVRHLTDDSTAICATTLEKFHNSEMIARFKRAYDMLKKYEGDRTVTPLGYYFDGQRPYLLMADFGGIPLSVPSPDRQLPRKGQPRTLRRSLKLGLQVAEALLQLHRKQLVHNRLRPDHIWYCTDTGELRLSGLERAFIEHSNYGQAYATTEEISPYTAPEQTGRLNHFPDCRADIYAFGTIMYEWLSGTLPYDRADPGELAYLLLAGQAPSLHEITPAVPRLVSDLVAKCMHKEPDLRYHSTERLCADLQRCLDQLDESGEVSDFELDTPVGDDQRTRRAERHCLYEREEQVAAIVQQWQNASGLPQIVLVEGGRGSGKSALIAEALRGHASGTHAIIGAYHLLTRDIPYYAIMEGLNQWFQNLNTGPSHIRSFWAERLTRKGGKEYTPLLQWLPELAHLLVQYRSGSELVEPPPGTLTDIDYALRRLLLAMAGIYQPLILVLDDAHWADQASLHLLEKLLDGRTGVNAAPLHVVLAYRPSANVQPLEKVAAQDANNVHLALEALSVEAVQQLMREQGWQQRQGESFALHADRLHAACGGNPLLLHKQLLQEQSLAAVQATFVNEGNRTSWTLAAWQHIWRQLSEADQSLLCWLAVAELPLSPDQFARLSKLSEEEAALRLEHWASRGVVQAIELQSREAMRQYRLDEEAAGWLRRSIPEEELSNRHRLLGDKYRQHGMRGEGVLALILAVVHMNQDQGSRSPQHFLMRGELQCRVGKLLGRLGYYEQAADFLNRAHADLSCGEQPNAAHWLGEVVVESMHIEHRLGHYEAAYAYFAQRLAQLPDPLQQAALHLMMMQLEIDDFRMEPVLELTSAALRLLHYEDIVPISRSKVISKWLRFAVSWLGKHPESLTQLPLLQDPQIKLTMDVLMLSQQASFYIRPNAWLSATLGVLELGVKHGVNGQVAVAVTEIGSVYCGLFNKMKKAYRWGNFGYEWSRRWPKQHIVARNAFMLMLPAWHSLNPGYLDKFILELESFESRYELNSDLMPMVVSATMLKIGRPLQEIRSLLMRLSETFTSKTNKLALRLSAIIFALIQDLQGEPLHIIETQSTEALSDSRNPWLKYEYYKYRYASGYFFGYYEQAYASFQEAEKLLQGEWRDLVDEYTHFFYGTLIQLEMYGIVTESEKEALLQRTRYMIARLKHYAHNNTRLGLSMYALVKAEKYRVFGANRKAELSYEESCSHAREHGQAHNLALASEAAGRFYLDIGNERQGRSYLMQAYQAYSEWGAHAKAEQLLVKYGLSIQQGPQQPAPDFDETALLNAAHAISEEVSMDRLLYRLIQIMMQNAGAQRVALLMTHNGKMMVEAEGADLRVRLERKTPEASEQISLAIVGYATRTCEQVVLNHACREGIFKDNAYIVENQVKSVLCLPIVKNGRLTAVLYMENRLVTRAFTPERLHVLKLLCSQFAISVENAALFRSLQRMNETLENQVRERTQSLEASMRETAVALAEASIQSDRNRIAADVHDIVGHTITSTLLQLEAGKRQLKRMPDDAYQRVEGAQQLLRQGLQEIRGSLHMLKDDQMTNLVEWLLQLIEKTEESTGVRVSTEVLAVPQLNPTAKHVIYRALQEGLTNGIRHGRATAFQFMLAAESGDLCFELRDNGEGQTHVEAGFGLTAMRERVELLGGSLRTETSPGLGFCLAITLPLDTVAVHALEVTSPGQAVVFGQSATQTDNMQNEGAASVPAEESQSGEVQFSENGVKRTV